MLKKKKKKDGLGSEGLWSLICHYLVNGVGGWRRKKVVCGIEFYMRGMVRKGVLLVRGEELPQFGGRIWLTLEVGRVRDWEVGLHITYSVGWKTTGALYFGGVIGWI